jgi:hypothetical protein
MSIHIEWVHAHNPAPRLLTPAEVTELAPDGNPDKDWGLSVSDTNGDGAMLFGTLFDIEQWLKLAQHATRRPTRKAENKRLKAYRKEHGLPKCKHPEWTLHEDMYTRTWGTEVDGEATTIVASYRGVEDFSDDGDLRYYLVCDECGHTKPVPYGYEIEWH